MSPQSTPKEPRKGLFEPLPCPLVSGSVRALFIRRQAPVAQLDRASDYGSGGWEFESSRARHIFQTLSLILEHLKLVMVHSWHTFLFLLFPSSATLRPPLSNGVRGVATIQERKNRNGKTSYRAIVWLKGVPPQTATFVRKTDARNWAHRVETEVRERRYFPKAIAGNHNLAEAITRYLEDVMPRKSRSAYTQKGQLQWWSNELGVYSLADLTPDVIIGARDRLVKEPNKTGGKLSKATVNRYMAALSHVLSVARDEWRWLDESPMPMVGKLKEAKGRVRFRRLSSAWYESSSLRRDWRTGSKRSSYRLGPRMRLATPSIRRVGCRIW